MDRSTEHRAAAWETGSKPVSALRVAILSYRSAPRVGGQGVYVDYLSRALSRAGAVVDVISGPPYPELDPKVRLIKLPSLDLYAQPHDGNLALRPRHLLSATDTYEYFGHLSGKFVEPYTFGQRVFKYFKRNADKYDVILDNQTLATGTLALQDKLNLPVMTMIHHPITQDRRLALESAPNWKHRLLVRRWYAFHHMQMRVANQLRLITCPSEHAKKDIVSEFGVDPDRIHPIPLGVDQDAFCPMPNVRRLPGRLVTTASSDTPLKGLPVLLQAYHQLLQKNEKVDLVIIGKLREGPTEHLIKKLGLSDKVQFKSDLTRAELAAEFNKASIAVTPSLYEGFGLPAAEAMSCGTPVIVTDGGALPEVAGDAGIIVPKGDADALATAISNLLNDREGYQQVAAACLKRAQSRFNWQKIAPKYLDLFKQTAEIC
ncbi:MAG: glycosyltransferase family 4 protein [Pseudomonadota bacterium]